MYKKLNFISDIVGEAVNQPTTKEQERNERLAVLEGMRITTQTEVQPEEYALSVDGVGFFALGDLHAIKGKQKCGKTSALKVCVAALLAGQQFRVKAELDAPRVLYLDTEQKKTDVKLIVTDALQMTGLDDDCVDERLAVYALRRRDFNQLKDDLMLLVSDFRPQVVIVDGIVEFVASFNDESLAKQLIHDLINLSEEHHCAIVCVLHTNKADEDHNMRGHLGTMLAQKAGTVLECKKHSGIITVSCSDARHAEMPDWSIAFNEQGHLLDADERRRQQLEEHRAEIAQRRQLAAEQKQKERQELALRIVRENNGCISRKDLTEKMAETLKLERTTISKCLSQFIEDKILYEANKTIMSSPETVLSF